MVCDLVEKFKIDRFSLDSSELNELLELISKDKELVSDIKNNWLMDEYISRVISIDRGMFPAQVLKRISELDSLQKNNLTMDQIVTASKNAKLSTSGRYRHKISGRKPSVISSKRVPEVISTKPSSTSGRRKFLKKSRRSPIILLIAALLILSFGVYYYTKMNTVTQLPVVETSKNDFDSPKIISAEKAVVIEGEEFKNSGLVGLSLKERTTLKVEKGGSLILEFSDRTRIDIQEESVLKLGASKNKELFLEMGRISCEVTKQKNHFKILTNNSVIQVLGTSFTLGIQKDIAKPININTELIVNQGKVEIENISTKEKVIVNQDQYIVVKNDKKLVVLEVPLKNLRYDFSARQLPKGLELVDFKNAEFLNGSLVVADGLAKYKLKTDGWKFPLKVSYRYKCLPSAVDKTIVVMSGVLWDDISYGILARGVPFTLFSGVWVSFDTYITEDNYIYSVCHSDKTDKSGNISSRFSFMERGKNSEALIILLKGWRDGDSEFDDIEVSEIKKTELPDIQEAKNIFKSLPRSEVTINFLYEKFPVIYNGKKEYRPVNIHYGAKVFDE